MSFTPEDAAHMARALQLAEQGLYTTDPNPRVGCVVVKDGEVIGEGAHLYAGEPHAEVHALRAAGTRARGATAYVTLEPCCHFGRTPPCSQALIDAGVARVVAAMHDPNPRVAGQGMGALAAAGVRTQAGLMEAVAHKQNPGFISRMQTGRPFVRAKIAASLDGRTALANGVSKWITGDPARADVQRWRARSSAILTGIGTVLADDPSLTVRDIPRTTQPLRVIVDRFLKTPANARMLQLEGRTLIATLTPDGAKTDVLVRAGAEVVTVPAMGDSLDFAGLLQVLGQREINEVLLEAGPGLTGAMLRARTIDQVILYFAPHLMGNQARGMFDLPSFTVMDERVALAIEDVRAVGADWRIIANVNYG